MFELKESDYFPKVLVGVNVSLALFDGILAVLAYFQLIRIHSRDSHNGWTRQKVFHLMVGSSNLGYFLYFILTLIAACKGWTNWSYTWGFILTAIPKILFFAAFLLLLSFWVDLCHQPNDEEDYDDDDDDMGTSSHAALLEKRFGQSNQLSTESHRKCFPFRFIHIGNRQKIVILVTTSIFIIMIAFSVTIWIGRGKNPIDSKLAARVYADLFAVTMFALGIALACYGIRCCLKMSKVRSDKASSEMWKVAGLSIVSVLCFTSSSLVALLTDIPMLYHWHTQRENSICTSLVLILYYFVGTSIPSAFVLWVMRELPPQKPSHVEETGTLTFIADSSVAVEQPQRWTAAASLQNQVSRASPI